MKKMGCWLFAACMTLSFACKNASKTEERNSLDTNVIDHPGEHMVVEPQDTDTIQDDSFRGVPRSGDIRH